jgi:hypothetical protein
MRDTEDDFFAGELKIILTSCSKTFRKFFSDVSEQDIDVLGKLKVTYDKCIYFLQNTGPEILEKIKEKYNNLNKKARVCFPTREIKIGISDVILSIM